MNIGDFVRLLLLNSVITIIGITLIGPVIGMVNAQSTTNLVIQVRTDNQTSWEITYCCPLFPPSYANPGSIPPFTGNHDFNITCSSPAGWSAYVQLISSSYTKPHLSLSVLKDGKVVASKTVNNKVLNIYTLVDADLRGTC